MKDEHSVISENDFNFSQEVIEKLAGYFSRRVVGQEKLKFSLVAAVIADLFICGSAVRTVGIAYFRMKHSVELIYELLHAPEAASCQI